MESNESLLNNDLQIDATAHSYLSETAKWAKFIAIAGFIFSFTIVIFALYYVSTMSNMRRAFGSSGGAGVVITLTSIFYGIVAMVWALVSFFQLRFAAKLQVALQVNDQVELNNAFQNLKTYYRISGIVTIISLLLTLLAVIGIVSSTPSSGF